VNKLRTWFFGLQQRERRALTVGGIAVAVLILVFGLLMPLQGAVSGLNRHNEIKRQDLAWMQVHQAEIASTAVPADRGEAPVVVVDRTAREAGLTDALRGTAPNGSGVRVQLDAAPFDAMVPWLAKLDENYGLAIESITLDRTNRPGLVNASITFAQSRH
jgi:general secretion pathway protein M